MRFHCSYVCFRSCSRYAPDVKHRQFVLDVLSNYLVCVGGPIDVLWHWTDPDPVRPGGNVTPWVNHVPSEEPIWLLCSGCRRVLSCVGAEVDQENAV